MNAEDGWNAIKDVLGDTDIASLISFGNPGAGIAVGTARFTKEGVKAYVVAVFKNERMIYFVVNND